jgi:hypothetical protein
MTPISLPNRPKNSKFICISSSFTPEGHGQAKFNDLATIHAGRDSESFLSRMKSAFKEMEKI